MKKSYKYNKVAGVLTLALAFSLTSCDDQIMEWKKQGDPVTSADIPLAVKEVLANYDDIKTYWEENHSNATLGLGVGAAQYLGTDGRRELARDNFQMITWGNAMKADALVKNNGSLNFDNLDPALDAILEDGLALYGHNFVWHTQQPQTYLKSLISPEYIVETDSDIKNLLSGDSFDFEGGTLGSWGCWGNNNPTSAISAEGEGYQSNYCAVLDNPTDGGEYNEWKAQFGYTFSDPLPTGKELTIRFKAKCSSAGTVQFQYQNGTTYGSQGGYTRFNVGTSWATYEATITVQPEDADRILLNFGAFGGTYYIDDIEFGEKVEDPMENVLAGDNSDFEGGTKGSWSSWGNSSTSAISAEGEGYKSDYSLVLTNPTDGGSGADYKAQLAYTFSSPLQEGKKYIIQFYAKSASSAGTLQFCHQNSTTYDHQIYYSFPVGTDWTLCEYEFTEQYDDVDRILINFGAVGTTYWIDNIKFGLAKDQGSSESKRYAPRKAAKSYYVDKTAEEKAAALDGALENFIKGVAEHLAEKGITPVGYDVINEAIADGSDTPRGYDGVFGMSGDSEPTFSVEEGLNLNWESGHFYWGYYLPDYPVKAFQYARQYLPAATKLFVNDYNLETSPGKLAGVIKFINDIDAANGSPIVDGIGTQMHITLGGTSDDAANNAEKVAALRAQVDAMFQTMAATGKMVRVTELDISLGTGSPSSAQYKAQSDAYKAVFESYFENVPEAQQSGITIWSLTDADDEHEYWLKGEVPNLFDKSFKRKWAYKGVCDAIAGEDLGLKYGGDDYKAFYEKQNVSESVK